MFEVPYIGASGFMKKQIADNLHICFACNLFRYFCPNQSCVYAKPRIVRSAGRPARLCHLSLRRGMRARKTAAIAVADKRSAVAKIIGSVKMPVFGMLRLMDC